MEIENRMNALQLKTIKSQMDPHFMFNALNSTHENRRYQRDWGNFYYYGAGDSRNRFSEYTLAYTLNEVLNPRVMRLGVRFQF